MSLGLPSDGCPNIISFPNGALSKIGHVISGGQRRDTGWDQEVSGGVESDSAAHGRAAQTSHQAGRGGAWQVRSAQETQEHWARGGW